MKSEKNIVVFTDLDGTLLDAKYSLKETGATVRRLLEIGVRIVFCSSKTRSELEYYRDRLGIKDPFIPENGAAIFVPKNYFRKDHVFTKRVEQYDIIEIGVSYSVIRKAFEKLRAKYGLEIVGFGDMCNDEIAATSGLATRFAALARQREYTEPFLIKEGNEQDVFDAVRKENLSCVAGGRYYHLVGNHDKGKATSVLLRMFAQELGHVLTIGVGDQLNDLSMLQVVDKPFLIEENSLRAAWESILKDITRLLYDNN